MVWVLGLVLAAPATVSARAAPLDLTPYKGKVVYLDFWASWCGPCRLSFPYIEQVASAYSSHDLVVLAVNVDHSRAKADGFLNSMGIHPTVIYDPSGAIARSFHISEMPTSILIDRSGHTRFVQQGFFENKISEYQAHIETLIHER